ncbi:hypothetical protein [Aliarcobacter butzleri]|uniref:hypothetical protein n=1 Tax=Aliarcobacter butzleri TaxID=28197 RepID=UPI00189F76CD|nr:hypothetical protein [Aliarcobacter butzleri]MBF7071593.1 hypothetical protein [Aliarcobacter butzleri]
MDEYINVTTGIGKIEENHGTININSSESKNKFEVRIDLKSFEKEVYQLYQFGKIFEKNNKDEWSHLRYKEDFDGIYLLSKEQINIFENIYCKGRDCSIYMSDKLITINYDFNTYPDLESIVNGLEESWISKINILEKGLQKSKEIYSNINKSYFSIEEMHILYEEQINLLKKIQKIVIKLKEEFTKKNENISNDVPEEIKKGFQYFNFIKKYPIRGLAICLFLIIFYNSSVIYEFFKHEINTKIFSIEITQKEKIKLKHIFFASSDFMELFNEKKDNKDVERSIYKNSLQEHFSALNFIENNLFKDTNIVDWLKNYDRTRALFEGHLDKDYPNYSFLYHAGLNLLVYIQSGTPIYLEDFVINWEKFKDNNDFIVPSFDTSKIKSHTDAVKIYMEILTWLKN